MTMQTTSPHDLINVSADTDVDADNSKLMDEMSPAFLSDHTQQIRPTPTRRCSDSLQPTRNAYCLAGQLISTCFRAQTNTSGICESEHAVAQISTWKAAGFQSVAVTGGFDLLTLNHVRALVQARILAASYLLGIDPSQPLTATESSCLLDFASSPRLKLLVSVDTNEAICIAKGNNPQKGNVRRPFLDWKTRAKLISTLAMPDNTGTARLLVDAITAHGPRACHVHEDCLVQKDGYEVYELSPDVIVMKDIYDAGNRPRSYDAANIVLFSEQAVSFTDSVLGGVVSTTNLIKRIKGE